MDLATATLLLGIFTLMVTGYIAWQQWQTNKNKLRLDLFDRRWAVFEAAMRLSAAAVHKAILTSEDIREFVGSTVGVRFLFNRGLGDYCDKLRKEALAIMFDTTKLERLPVGDERTGVAKTLQERQLWFSDQLDNGIPKRFAPFLKVRG